MNAILQCVYAFRQNEDTDRIQYTRAHRQPEHVY